MYLDVPYLLFLKKILKTKHTAANIMPHTARTYTMATKGTADDSVISTAVPSGGIPSVNMEVYINS